MFMIACGFVTDISKPKKNAYSMSLEYISEPEVKYYEGAVSWMSALHSFELIRHLPYLRLYVKRTKITKGL